MNLRKEDEQIVLILDDPVNSNDWGNFFKFQAIIEDYFYKDIFENKKISNIIILSHNIDYAVIQLDFALFYLSFLLVYLNICDTILNAFHHHYILNLLDYFRINL